MHCIHNLKQTKKNERKSKKERESTNEKQAEKNRIHILDRISFAFSSIFFLCILFIGCVMCIFEQDLQHILMYMFFYGKHIILPFHFIMKF